MNSRMRGRVDDRECLSRPKAGGLGLIRSVSRLAHYLGHMGETLPYMFWRLDSRYALTQTDRKLKMTIALFEAQFFRHHLWTILGRAAPVRHLRPRRR